MWKHINISNKKTLENIDSLKSFYNIFQTTKLIDYLVDKELKRIDDSWNYEDKEEFSEESKVVIKNKEEIEKRFE